MAQVTVTRLLDGSRNAAFHVHVAGDGSGEVDEVIIDPETSFDPALPAAPTLTLVRLCYDLAGFSAQLAYEYLTSDMPLWTMSENTGEFDFSFFGGLKDRSDVDGTGKIKLNTRGLGQDDHGTFILYLRKN